jgi:lysophospholipase L1-like esterase
MNELEQRINNDWAYLKFYEEENKKIPALKADENRVVFLGDSITENWKNYDSAFFANKPYFGRGISGQTTPQMLVRFRQDVLNLNPKILVLMAGTNDVAENTGPYIPENTMGNIITMTELAKLHNIRVLLCSVLPASDFNWHPGLNPADKIVNLNRMIQDYAAKNNITYVDFYPSLVNGQKGLKQAYSEDGVHPNLSGYKVMDALVEEAITKALKAS